MRKDHTFLVDDHVGGWMASRLDHPQKVALPEHICIVDRQVIGREKMHRAKHRYKFTNSSKTCTSICQESQACVNYNRHMPTKRSFSILTFHLKNLSCQNNLIFRCEWALEELARATRYLVPNCPCPHINYTKTIYSPLEKAIALDFRFPQTFT